MPTDTQRALELASRLTGAVRGRSADGLPEAWVSRLRALGATRVVALPLDWPGLPPGLGAGARSAWAMVALPPGAIWTAGARPDAWDERAAGAPEPIPTVSMARRELVSSLSTLAELLETDGRGGHAAVVRDHVAMAEGAGPPDSWAVEQAATAVPGAPPLLAAALQCETIAGGGALAELLAYPPGHPLGDALRAARRATVAAIAATAAS